MKSMHDRHALRRVTAGYTALESIISVAILSAAMIGFFTAMTTATKVSNEELSETDIQTQTRDLTEDLVRDLDSASICYMTNSGQATLGPAITTNDADNPADSFLLFRYQVQMVNNDPSDKPNFGTPVYPLQYGAFPPSSNIGTPGACYTIVFKLDQRVSFIKEADPATSPAPVAGTRYIFKDLDGDGAYTSVFAVGRLERRYSPGFSVAAPEQTAATDLLDKLYPNDILIEWDVASKSPRNTVFKWLEDPGGNNGYSDNCYHMFPLAGTTPVPAYVPASVGPPPAPEKNIGNWRDDNFNGQWDPVLQISLRFLAQPDDGRPTNSDVRMKIASTSAFLRNQAK
jgi:hypothetical protein